MLLAKEAALHEGGSAGMGAGSSNKEGGLAAVGFLPAGERGPESVACGPVVRLVTHTVQGSRPTHFHNRNVEAMLFDIIGGAPQPADP
jgi:hypothetical protein